MIKRGEVSAFLNAVYQTRLWKGFYQFLKSHGHPYARDEGTLKDTVKQLWFDSYSRARGVADTSGFEHVFMGEAKNGEVSGMHNWVTFYLRERNSSDEFDYKGFVVKRFNVMAAVRYEWRRLSKPGGTFLIGTSPEFDLLLYTTCFLARRGRSTCNLDFEGCPLTITSYDLIQQNQVYVG
ncbi:Protein K02A11.3 [Aphelenchoides avenae]|nr:Protein K02A11.3 [Aphelenchus avenae]